MKLIKTPQVVAFVMTAGIALIAFLGASNKVSDLAVLEGDVRPTAVFSSNTQPNDIRAKSKQPHEPIQPLTCPNQAGPSIPTTADILSNGYLITKVQPSGHEQFTMVLFNHPDLFKPTHLLIFNSDNIQNAPVYHALQHHIQFEPYPNTLLAKAADLSILTDINKNNYMEVHYVGFDGGNGLASAWVCILELNDDPTQPHVQELGFIVKSWK